MKPQAGASSAAAGLLPGLLSGLLLVLLAAVLLLWSQGRSPGKQGMLDAARAELTEVGSERVHPEHDGRLVHVRGMVAADELLLDPDFDQRAEGLALRRVVQMYQWHEHVPGDAQDVATAVNARPGYRLAWSEQHIEHRTFAAPAGHENPDEFPLVSRSWQVARARLGAFELDPGLIASIDGWKPMAADIDRLAPNLAASFRVDGRWLSSSDDPAEPRVGDLRIGHDRLVGGPMSVIAMQRDGRLQAWPFRGGELLLLRRGEHSAAQLLDALAVPAAGAGLWLPMGGFVLMWAGFALLLSPRARGRAADAASRPPWVAMLLLAGALAVVISFAVIGSGILFDRPGVLLALLLVLGLVAGLYAGRKRVAA
jgi:hypothetical protein